MQNYAVYHAKNRNTGMSKRIEKKRLQHSAILFLTLFAVILGILAGSNLLTASRSNASHKYEKELCYKTVRIESGDTLWSIADTYMDAEFGSKTAYIDQIKEINNVHDGSIHAGAYLVVPYYKTVR